MSMIMSMNIDRVAGTGLAILGALWLVVSVGCVPHHPHPRR